MSQTYRIDLRVWSAALPDQAAALDTLTEELWEFEGADPQPDGSVAYTGVDQLVGGTSAQAYATQTANRIKVLLGPDTRVQIIATYLDDAAGVTYEF